MEVEAEEMMEVLVEEVEQLVQPDTSMNTAAREEKEEGTQASRIRQNVIQVDGEYLIEFCGPLARWRYTLKKIEADANDLPFQIRSGFLLKSVFFCLFFICFLHPLFCCFIIFPCSCPIDIAIALDPVFKTWELTVLYSVN